MCSNEELKARLTIIEDCVGQNNRTLRGGNGDGGLVQKVALLQTTLNNVETQITNELHHLTEIIALKMKSEEEKTLHWPSLLKGLIVPIGISILSALGTALVVTKLLGLP